MATDWIARTPEPELMDTPEEVRSYSEGDFSEVNGDIARCVAELGGERCRLVDLGCGPAQIPVEIARLRPRWRIVAVDAGENMLAAAREEVTAAGLDDRIECLLADVRHVPRPAGSFDIVLSNSLLHHLEDPLALWSQALRLLQPGGQIFVQDLCRPRSRDQVDRLVKEHAGDASGTLRELFRQSLLAAFTVEEVREQLRLCGLRGCRVEKITDRHLRVEGRKA